MAENDPSLEKDLMTLAEAHHYSEHRIDEHYQGRFCLICFSWVAGGPLNWLIDSKCRGYVPGPTAEDRVNFFATWYDWAKEQREKNGISITRDGA